MSPPSPYSGNRKPVCRLILAQKRKAMERIENDERMARKCSKNGLKMARKLQGKGLRRAGEWMENGWGMVRE